jgi:phosphoenolpyruvate---glycerone phosphotransferase subunit DhaL
MITKAQILRWLELCQVVLAENKAYLSQLDAAIGDADHGINMARGFDKVAEKLPGVADMDIGNILKTTGMTLMFSVGGASGPLYGTFFMRASTAVNPKEELTPDDVVQLLENGANGIIERGRAQVGEKTMLDTWIPAITALKESLNMGHCFTQAMENGVCAAEQGMKNTIPMLATKGRASYLGPRSIGHQDPGATSAYLMLNALLEVIR